MNTKNHKENLRFSSFSNKPITQGYCVLDGLYYFADDEESHLLKICLDNGYESLEDAYNDDFYYWTEWN